MISRHGFARAQRWVDPFNTSQPVGRGENGTIST
jgi:hypothetical protein